MENTVLYGNGTFDPLPFLAETLFSKIVFFLTNSQAAEIKCPPHWICKYGFLSNPKNLYSRI